MRIVDINPYFYPWLGGIEHRMHYIAKELVKRGHEVIIITGRLPDTEEDEMTEFGYRVIRLPSKMYKVYHPPYITSKGLLEKLNEIQPDIVNYNYRWAPSYNKDMRKYKGKKIYTCHNTYGEGVGWQKIPSTINDKLFFRHIREYDYMIFVSAFFLEDFKRRGYDISRATVIEPCMDVYPELTGKEGDFILVISRLVAVKGLKYLLEAMKDIDCKLVICGKGPEDKRLRKQAEELGLMDKVEFKGFVSEEEKARLQTECKLAILPSIHDTFPIAAIELMAHGKPIVCTNVDGLPLTVRDGGVIVPPKDPKALADAINDLLYDDEKRKEISKRARARAEELSVENITDKLVKLFEKVVNE